MAKEKYKDKAFNEEKTARIRLCNQIIVGYQRQNLKLTLRQLYYQLVTRNAITNTERSYKNLGSLLSDARLAGLVDWDAIEDRVRVPKVPNEWDSASDFIESLASAFRLPRWEGQRNYVELWVEKDALAGVLHPLAREFHVTLMVNRGYSSQSAMYEAAQRFSEHDDKRRRILFYLGDHDPSGEDMVRDIGDRLTMFGQDVEVNKLALTMDQVREHDPPPNPAKMSDSRAAGYVAEHGDSSWEVDALPPQVLQQIIREAFEEVHDPEMMEEIKVREREIITTLREAARQLS